MCAVQMKQVAFSEKEIQSHKISMRDFNLLFNNDLLNISFVEECPRCWELLALFEFLLRCSDNNVVKTIGEDQKVIQGVSQLPQSQVQSLVDINTVPSLYLILNKCSLTGRTCKWINPYCNDSTIPQTQ